MRPHQRLSYAERIDRALALLEDCVGQGETPSVERLAAAAALSPFHFHRVFRLMTGETVGEAVVRIRLGKSLAALPGRDGIRAAADRSGYATSQSYARALKARSGATPSQLRVDDCLRERVVEELRRPVTHDLAAPPLSIEVVSFEPVRLLALRNVGDYAELDRGYRNLFELLIEQVEPDAVTGLWGIPHDDPRFVPPHECRFDCAVSTDGRGEAKGAIRQLDVSGDRCLRMRVPGDYDQAHALLDDLYRVAIARNLPIADCLPIMFYHADPEEVPVKDLLADIHLFLTDEEAAS